MKLSICVLGLRGLPDVMGGVEMHCEQLFPLMKAQSPHYSFTIIGRKAYLPRRVGEYQGLRIISLPHARSKYFETITNTVYGVIYARFALRSNLLHLHGIGPSLVAPIAKTLGMKVVVTYHSKNYEHRKWNLPARVVFRIGELCAVVFADRVIAVSRSIARDLKKRFPRAAGRVYFIPNGANHVDTARSESEARSNEAILWKHNLERSNYIVAVGRLVPEKGFHDLLTAFERSEFRGKLVIAGAADHHDVYSNQLLEKAGDRLVFTGFVSKDTVYSLLINASLFVLPSYYEGLPIAALEAIGAGAAVLLSDIEANRDLGLNPNNYFKVGNLEDLRYKISQDHKNYQLDQFDRLKILQQHDWHAISVKTDKVYSTLKWD